MKMRQQLARVEIARRENEGNAIVWNTECCICLSIAEQDCVSKLKTAQISPPPARVEIKRFCVCTSLNVMTLTIVS